MILIAIQYRCIECGLTVEIPRPLPPCALPAAIGNVTVPAPPVGWSRDEGDGGVHCAQHQPSRIVQATIVPALHANGRKPA